MTRIASIAGALDKDRRADLAKELDRLLPGAAAQCKAFLRVADEALDEYRKLLKPAADDLERLEDRLWRLAKAGQEFAQAVAKLDDDARDRVEQSAWAVLDRRGEVPDFVSILAAAEVARDVVKASDHLRERYHNRASGPRRDKALTALIRHLALGYDRIFRERPSSARNGTFGKALNAILSAGDLKAEIGETMLSSILASTPLCGERPRRGPKKRPA